MNKKQLKNKLNKENGITGADVLIALLIILTTLGVIGTVYVNLVLGSKGIDRRAGATRIATNLLENIETLYYDEIQENLDTLSNLGTATKVDTTYTIPGGNKIKILNTSIPKGYKAIIQLQKSYGTEESLQYDLVRKVTLKIEYLLDGQTKHIELNKVLEREVIRECNSPQFTEDYIRQIVPKGTEYEMYSQSAEGVQTGVKIICPVQYDAEKKQYKIVENVDSLWYSYSNKQWAQILILESDELANSIDSITKTVTDLEILKSNKSYVWIPRFGVENGGDFEGDTKFKYKNTDLAIVSSYYEDNTLIYNQLKNIEWSNRGILFENNDELGKWSPYSDLTKNRDRCLLFAKFAIWTNVRILTISGKYKFNIYFMNFL